MLEGLNCAGRASNGKHGARITSICPQRQSGRLKTYKNIIGKKPLTALGYLNYQTCVNLIAP